MRGVFFLFVSSFRSVERGEISPLSTVPSLFNLLRFSLSYESDITKNAFEAGTLKFWHKP